MTSTVSIAPWLGIGIVGSAVVCLGAALQVLARATKTPPETIRKLYGEAELLAVARAYQEATGYHNQHPKL